METNSRRTTAEVVSILTSQPSDLQSRKPMELKYNRPDGTTNKLKLFIKKIIAKLCTFLIVPVINDQNAINSNFARQIEELQKKNRQLEAEIKELRNRV